MTTTNVILRLFDGKIYSINESANGPGGLYFEIIYVFNIFSTVGIHDNDKYKDYKQIYYSFRYEQLGNYFVSMFFFLKDDFTGHIINLNYISTTGVLLKYPKTPQEDTIYTNVILDNLGSLQNINLVFNNYFKIQSGTQALLNTKLVNGFPESNITINYKFNDSVIFNQTIYNLTLTFKNPINYPDAFYTTNFLTRFVTELSSNMLYIPIYNINTTYINKFIFLSNLYTTDATDVLDSSDKNMYRIYTYIYDHLKIYLYYKKYDIGTYASSYRFSKITVDYLNLYNITVSIEPDVLDVTLGANFFINKLIEQDKANITSILNKIKNGGVATVKTVKDPTSNYTNSLFKMSILSAYYNRKNIKTPIETKTNPDGPGNVFTYLDYDKIINTNHDELQLDMTFSLGDKKIVGIKFPYDILNNNSITYTYNTNIGTFESIMKVIIEQKINTDIDANFISYLQQDRTSDSITHELYSKGNVDLEKIKFNTVLGNKLY